MNPSSLPTLDEVQGPSTGFLQVLISGLECTKISDQGLRFEIALSGQEPCILNPKDKSALVGAMDRDEGQRHEADLAHFRRHAAIGDRCTFDFQRFWPRHASGGALALLETPKGLLSPLVFHRDIAPIGWNLANGASATRTELRDLRSVAEREMGEELMFWDPDASELLTTTRRLGVEGEHALELWQEALGAQRASDAIAFESIEGPDTISVHDAQGGETTQSGFFVGLQAEDAGLEALRMCIFPEGLIPLDGELGGASLLDRTVARLDGESFDELHPRVLASYRRGVPIEASLLRLCPATAKLAPAFAAITRRRERRSSPIELRRQKRWAAEDQ